MPYDGVDRTTVHDAMPYDGVGHTTVCGGRRCTKRYRTTVGKPWHVDALTTALSLLPPTAVALKPLSAVGETLSHTLPDNEGIWVIW